MKIRKFVSLSLALVLALCTFLNVSTANVKADVQDYQENQLLPDDDGNLPETIFIEHDKMLDSYNVPDERGSRSNVNSEIVTAKKSEIESIYEDSNGTMLSYAGEGIFQPVDLFTMEAGGEISKELSGLPEEVKKAIIANGKQLKLAGNNNATVTVAVPEGSLSQEGVLRTKAQTTSNYTYNGKKMRDVKVAYSNLSTQTKAIASGTGTKKAISAVVQTIVEGAGTQVTPLGFALTGISILSIWQEAQNWNVIQTSTQDFCEYYAKVDKTTCWTYVQTVQNGEYYLGSVTH